DMEAGSPESQPQSTHTPVRDPRREIFLHCDEVTLNGEGVLSVEGWAVCAIGVSAVTVRVDGNAIGSAELGMVREDVGDEYRHIPLARYSGFRLKTVINGVVPGEHRVQVEARNGLDDLRDEVRVILIDPPAPPPRTEFRLEIDTPAVAAGVAVEPITGRLTIEGWALARSGIAGIEVLLDDQR